MTLSRRIVKAREECILLYVEDDDATAFLFQTALDEAEIELKLFRVTDGEEASAFLSQTGAYENAPCAGPRGDGHQPAAEERSRCAG